MITVGLLLLSVARKWNVLQLPHKDEGEFLGREDSTLVSESRRGRGYFGGRNSTLLQLQFISPVLGVHFLVLLSRGAIEME